MLQIALICDIILFEVRNMSEQFIEIGKRIKELREKNSMTLEEVGNSLQVHKTTIMRWENGQTEKIKLPMLEALSKLFKVSPDYLITGKKDLMFEEINNITKSEKSMLLKFRELAPDDQKYIAGLIDRFHETIDAVIIKENIKKTD
jgi:transcriptional regulator with XRE-family HTH domain